MYRSTKCILGNDQFGALNDKQREKIVDLLVEAIKKSVTLGAVIAMEKTEYAAALLASPNSRAIAGDKYSVCLVRCIENMAAWLNRKDIPGRVQYVFEAGCNHQAEADAILRGISRSPELKQRYRWHSYIFADKGPDIPQLFAPDLLAWEWQRAHINAMNPQRGEWRLTLKRLFDGTPHLPEYETSTSVDIRAIVNAFYGVTPIA